MHRTVKANHSSRRAAQAARDYYFWQPHLNLYELVALARTARVNAHTDDAVAYKLSFIIGYCIVSGIGVPDSIELDIRESVNMLTQSTQGKDFSTMNFSSLNQCTFIGRLGKDPEFNMTASGKGVSKGSLAIDEYGGRDEATGEAIRNTLWLNWVAWEYLANQAEQYLNKGDKVMMQGRLSIRKYKDREGIQRQATEIILTQIVKLSDSANGNGNGSKFEKTDTTDPFLPDYPDEPDRVPTGELSLGE